jgi:dipeptidyl aminopeptidase/acylaminoacyl peptidase
MKMMRVVEAVGVVWLGVLGLAVAAGQSAGQKQIPSGNDKQKRPMTFADLMAMKRVSDPQISPSGKWVMFSVTDVSLEKNTKVNHLWVVALNGENGGSTPPKRSLDGAPGSGAERQVTFGSGESFGRFSPDGKLVSFTADANGVSQIHLATWREEQGNLGESRDFTLVSTGADGAIWSPDSKRLIFVADVYPECSDKPTWDEEDACNKAKDDAATKSPVKGQVWGALLYRHWDHYTGLKRTHILVESLPPFGINDVRDLTPRSVVGDAETPTFSLGGPLGYAWAPDSKEIAYVTNLDKVPAASTNNDVFTLRPDEAGAKAVKVSTSPGSDDGPAYSPDGKWLAFRSQARGGFESDLFRLVMMDRVSGKINSNVMPGYTDQQRKVVGDNWVDEFVWAPDSKHIAYASPDRGREAVRVISVVPSPGPPSDWLAVDGELGSLGFASDGAIVATRMYVNQPTEVVLLKHTQAIEKGYDIISSNTDITPITHLNGGFLSQLDLAKLEPFWFAGAEGTQVEGFIVKPPNFDPAKKYPVKFLMHGGPQTAWGDGWSFRWNWELMAANGYVVVGINRRGSTGYGQKFVDEVSGDWGGRAYVDLMKGLDYAEAKYPFMDKTRECALGASYGGFMADWVLTHTNRFKCIVTHDGMYDPVSAWGDTEEMWFNEWEFRRPADYPKGWDGFTGAGATGKTNTEILTKGQNDERGGQEGRVGVGHPAEPWRYASLPADQDPFRRWSPMLHIQDAKTPTLVIHSQKDYRLDVSQGMELFTALQRLNVPSKMLYFPDEGHWILKPQNSQMWNEVVGDWCDRWTKTGKYAEKQ